MKAKQQAETSLFIAKDSFEWILNNYKKLTAPKAMMKSPTFQVDGITCWLSLYPRGDSATNRDWVSLFLTVSAPIETTFTFEFLDAEGQVIPVTTRSMDFSYTFPRNSRGWGSSRVIRTSEVDNFLRDGVLRIRCLVYLHTVVTKESTLRTEIEKAIPEDDALGRDIEKLMQDFPTDVQFEVDGEVFKAHKMILAVRSPVFRAMFGSGMKEQSSDSIVISDVPALIFKEMMKYIYSGKCEESLVCRYPEDYIHMADKYDLPGLRQQAEKILVAGVRVDNAIAMLSLANTFNLSALYKVAMLTVVNHFKAIKSTQLFKDMCSSSPELLEQVIDEVAHLNPKSKHISKEESKRIDITSSERTAKPVKKIGFLRLFGKSRLGQ